MMPQGIFHLTRHELERFRVNRSGPVEKRKVMAHLLAGCQPCRESAREMFFPRKLDYTRVFERLDGIFHDAETAMRAERRRGEELWHLLEPLDATQRLLWVKNDPRLHIWGLYNLLLNEGRKVLRQDRCAAVDLYHLAWMIAQKLSPEVYGDTRVRDFQATAATQLGNAKRLYGDLRGAEEDFARAEELLELGTGDLLEHAYLLGIRATLKSDLGYFEDAAAMFREAVSCAHQMGDLHLEATHLIGWSSSVGWVDPERGLELAERAEARLEPAADPHLELGARHLKVSWMSELGRTAEARDLLEACRPLYALYPDPVTQGRLLRQEGHLARNEGNLEESERKFRELVALYERHDFDFDLALGGVELSQVLSLRGKVAEAGSILRGLYPFLESRKLHNDILRSWLVLQEAVQRDAVQAQMFRDLAMTLRRKWLRR
jgi:tetratricopeptide (TPR) repeat protein